MINSNFQLDLVVPYNICPRTKTSLKKKKLKLKKYGKLKFETL